MTENLTTGIADTFSAELRSFFTLCLLSLVFGSLAMAFGMQFIVTAVLAMAESGNFGIFPFLQALAGWAAAVVGFRWILSSARIMKGVNRIRREYRAVECPNVGVVGKEVHPHEKPVPGEAREHASGETRTEPVAGEALTGLIIRMMAHYRENWKTIWRMNLISILGGAILIALGLINILQGISGWYSATDLSYLLPFLAAGINLTIGLVSLHISSGFRRYSRAWELRLAEAGHSEEALEKALEKG